MPRFTMQRCRQDIGRSYLAIAVPDKATRGTAVRPSFGLVAGRGTRTGLAGVGFDAASAP